LDALAPDPFDSELLELSEPELLDDELESVEFELESLEPELESEAEIFFLLPDLKSVSYQPLPFKRKAAADTCFFMVDLPHSEHFFSGLSLTFCNTSSS